MLICLDFFSDEIRLVKDGRYGSENPAAPGGWGEKDFTLYLVLKIR